MATKQRHQTWGPPPSPVDQLRVDLGLAPPPKRRSVFRGRRRGEQSPTHPADRLIDALTDRLEDRHEQRPRHSSWGDNAQPGGGGDDRKLPAVKAAPDLVRYSEAELARFAEIAEDRAARYLPFQAGAVVAAVTGATWGAAELADMAAGQGGRALVAVLAAVAVLLTLASWAFRHRNLWAPRGRLRPWRRRAVTASALTACWVAVAAATGPSWQLAAAGVLAGAAVAVGWLRAHEITVLPPVEDEADAEPEHVIFARRWAERIAADNGLMPRSLLVNGRNTDDHEGMTFVLELPYGWTLTKTLAIVEQIASALGCDARQLVIEAVPADAKNWVDASRALLTFLWSSAIIGSDDVEHTGPNSTTPGRIGIGPYIDGSGEAEFVLADGESVWSGFVCGATGAGKSELVTALVADGRATLPVVTVYWDGKRGSSSPDLAAAATVKAFGPEEAERFTACVEELVKRLGDRAAATGESSFQWGPGRPIYWVVLDEADMLFRLLGMAARWAIIAKTLRSLGGGLLPMSQEGDLSVFGNNGLLRSSVCRNVVLMHIPTGDTSSLVGSGVLPSAATIPMGGGYAHLKAEGSRPRQLLRGRRLRSSRACEREGLDPDVAWGARRALREAPDAPMCEVGQQAFAPLLDGVMAPDEADKAVAEAPAVVTAGEAAPTEEQKASARAAWGQASVAPISSTTPAEPVAAALPDGLTDNQRAALDALRVLDDGLRPVPTGRIADKAGLRPDSTSRVLRALTAKGWVRDAGRAGWSATTTASTTSPTVTNTAC